jgi:hypothetical protein
MTSGIKPDSEKNASLTSISARAYKDTISKPGVGQLKVFKDPGQHQATNRKAE